MDPLKAKDVAFEPEMRGELEAKKWRRLVGGDEAVGYPLMLDLYRGSPSTE